MSRYIKVLHEYRKDIEKNVYSEHPRFFESYINRFGELEYKNIPKEGILYTSGDVAFNIINNGFIWLNDVKNMNDRTEMKYAVSYFQNHIDEFCKNPDMNHQFIQVLEEIYNEHRNKFYIDHEIKNEKLVMAMCFTQAKDDATMWDRYANKGKGVAIHFNLEKLFFILKNAGIFFPNTSSFEYGIDQVCYPDNNQCDCFKNMYNEALYAYAIAKTQDELNSLRTFLHTHVLELLMSHKHPSFSSEKEIRMYSQAPSKKTWSGSDHIHEHGDGDNASYHMILNLGLESMMAGEDNLWNELIKKVVMGPNAEDKTRKQVKTALQKRDLKGILFESECPLRA